MPLVAVGLPLTASAQTSDAAYCKALTARYEAFVDYMNGHSNQPGGVDGSVAVEQCKEGTPPPAIPVLERKLAGCKDRTAQAQLVELRVDRGGRPLGRLDQLARDVIKSATRRQLVVRKLA